ncbi:MAG: hypothetical protein VKJ05_01685 [Synechococcaceae cyanobacterium]|nr:hypothetical protein [Synechococcaceae cyanobacterium]
MSPLLLLLLLLMPLAIFLADGNWRDSLIYSVVIGFLQDPLRKITPNQPSLYVGLVLIGVVLTALLLYSRTGRLSLEALFSRDRQLIGVVEIFLGLLLLQSLNSFLNLGSTTLTLVGMGFYLSPLIALWLGFQFALQPSAVQRFVRMYLVMAFLFAFTLFLSYRGLETPLFKEVGSGVLINIVELGTMQQGFVGLWRTSEIAAWHLATACCFLLILAVSSRRSNLISLAGAAVVVLLVLSTLTGRRKVLTLVVGFIGLYSLFIALRGDSRIRGNVLVGFGGAGLLISLLLSSGVNPTDSGTLGGFVRRTASVWGDIDERFQGSGLGAIGAAIEAAGPFGYGVGAAAQGAKSLGIQVSQGTWAAEGGLGKIAAELGLAGITLFVMIIVLLGFLYWRIIGQLRFAPPSYSLLNLGLLSFLAANLPNFAVASQAYGDPFILSILGVSAGFVLASPTVIGAHLQAQKTSSRPQSARGAPPARPVHSPPKVRS